MKGTTKVSGDKTQKKAIELTEIAKADRLSLSQLLIEQTDDIAKEALEFKRKREQEKIELHSGLQISISEINSIVSANRRPYEAMFPNSIPFFKEMYRLNGWTDLNPNSYTKPPVVARWINEIIYGRFSKDVLPAIQVLNPYINYATRLHKNFQYLTNEGQQLLEQYRDEAIEVMKKCSSWHEFRVKYSKEYGVPFQGSLYEANC